MKKLMFVLFLLCGGITCLMAQNSQNNQLKEGEYLIRGKIGGDYAGKIYLSEWIGEKFVDIDSVEVQKGNFTFRGQAPEVVKLVFLRNNEGRSALPFFLETGMINVNLPGQNFSWGGQVNGTINNAVLAKYKRDAQYLLDSVTLEAGIEELSKSITDAERREAFGHRSKFLAQRGTQIVRQVIERFSGLPVAAYLIERHLAPGVTPQEVEQAVNGLDSALADHPLVLQIRNDLKSKMFKVGDEAFEFPKMKEGEKPIRLADYKGKYLLLDFWASWCGPCMKEMPELVKLYKECKGKKFDLVGISLDQKKADCEAAVKKMGMKWRQISDVNAWDGELARLYNVKSIPYTVLIGPDSKVIAIGLRGEELVAKVRELLKKY